MKNKILKIFLFLSLVTFSSNSFAKFLKFKTDDIKAGKEMDEKYVFNGFGCNGNNLSPTFQIEKIPEKTKSLAITMFDPDAPTGSGWWHWIVYNIDPTTTLIDASSEEMNKGATYGRNDYGDYAYGGPCPPVNARHNYIFTIYALDVEKLDVPKEASAAMIGFNLNAHTIQKRDLSAIYWRKISKSDKKEKYPKDSRSSKSSTNY